MFHQLTLRPTACAVANAPGSVIERCEGLRFALLTNAPMLHSQIEFAKFAPEG